MNLLEIYNALERIAPNNLCEQWDNSGILVHAEQEISKVLVTLDITSKIIEEAIDKKCQLIISHHPILFKPIQKISNNDLTYKLIRNNISVISMHTNLDKAQGGVNDVLSKILGLNDIEAFAEMGRKGTLSTQMQVKEFAKIVSKALKVPVKYSLPDALIYKVAVIGGSAGEYWIETLQEGADILITGEASYHDVLDAMHMGIPIIVAGHWGTEIPLIKELANTLTNSMSNVVFEVSQSNNDPFCYCNYNI